MERLAESGDLTEAAEKCREDGPTGDGIRKAVCGFSRTWLDTGFGAKANRLP
jgi:hypothetical protein